MKNSDEQIHHRGVLPAIHEHGSQLVQFFLADRPTLAAGLGKLLDVLEQNVLLDFSYLVHSHNPFVKTMLCACNHHHGNHSRSLAPRSFVDYLQENERKLMACVKPSRIIQFCAHRTPRRSAVVRHGGSHAPTAHRGGFSRFSQS